METQKEHCLRCWKKVWKINRDEQDKYEKIVSKDALRLLEITITSSSRMAPLLKTAWGCSRRTLRRCGRRRFALLALLTATLLTILCGASLNYRSLHSFATNPMIWSRRWRWWEPSAGTPWRRPALASGPGSLLFSQLTAVLLNMLIVNLYICFFLLQ
jgi:hypothetical protein